MGDLLAKASDWLMRQRRKHLTREVQYVRGQSSVGVAATASSTDFQSTDANGFPVTFTSTDWLINVADLELDGIPVEPQRGDRVMDGPIDSAVVYEVLNDTAGPPFRYADGSNRKVYRVHTRHVDTKV